MDKSFITLEFTKILDMLSALAVSDKARKKLSALRPFLSESEAARKSQETTDAKRILECLGTPPLTSMKEIEMIIELCAKGAMLLPEQLLNIVQFLSACRHMKAYLKRAEDVSEGVALYGGSIDSLQLLYEEIDRSIRNGLVVDSASPLLRDIRRKVENANSQMKAKLESLLRSKKEWFADSYVSTRNGHFVLPVKKEFRNQITGTVIDTSSTGGTCFIEPSSVRKIQEEISLLLINEDNEVRRVLYTLTALVDDHIPQLGINLEAMEALDVVFAKAKLSAQMNAISVPVTSQRKIVIQSGRHPLLKPDCCIPLDFEIGDTVSGVIITGPNTGGKTVALKTVGLLSIMAQCGLHVPAAQGSVFCLHNLVLCDIGDGQSITENLSTFSAHLNNIIEILQLCGNESLVLLDELGSGTDPAEGMGIAIAVLEELKRKNCLFVATTHYPEIKEYAKITEGLVNARMAFDRESLCPLYRLEIGEAGESCALYIAKRLGFPEHLLKTAYEVAYNQPMKQAASPFPPISAQPPADLPQQTESADFVPRIKKEKPKQALTQPLTAKFSIGDSVLVYPQKEIGIVYQPANEHGEVGVQVKREKRLIPHKRIKLQVPADELYPPDYDFAVVFDTVANRKARHVLGKRHDPNLIIEHQKGDDSK